ncbi:hypothetical protein SEUBUCD646_0D01600 [Saccharomyces eubayanus]|uniref:Small EDRK-rich factor-like N-terminal domain-containing protein n=1 Tax=Saccharomyces eubayanus TaxID=1080349 RepID=A0ABN8VQG1_SACEU|nr:hypothetical protein SEUBUCD650_0D01590 [Saccharomyces eubayanus]CAI1933643.1 hypothetical protein SEUBUCD646_0D01600 [Saccharomyces eubayanus]
MFYVLPGRRPIILTRTLLSSCHGNVSFHVLYRWFQQQQHSTAAQQQDYTTPHHTSQGGTSFIMARGNQRDLARQKNMKKQKDLAKSQKKNGDPKKRMESDADILRQKQAAADARREAELLEKLKAEKARK